MCDVIPNIGNVVRDACGLSDAVQSFMRLVEIQETRQVLKTWRV